MKRTIQLQLELIQEKKSRLNKALDQVEEKIAVLKKEKSRLEDSLDKLEKHEAQLRAGQTEKESSPEKKLNSFGALDSMAKSASYGDL